MAVVTNYLHAVVNTSALLYPLVSILALIPCGRSIRVSYRVCRSHKQKAECYSDTYFCSLLLKWGRRSLHYQENNL